MMRTISRALTLAAMAALAGCGAEATITEVSQPPDATAALHRGRGQNSILFPREAHPYGVSMATWADRESQWVYSQPLEHNPLLDQSGADCGVGQNGPVWFLPRIAGPRVFSGTRTCTIPHGRAIFLEIGAYVNPYPCPDPDFRPAPGQSLYDFLIADAKAFMDGVNHLEVSLDGRALHDVLSYRYHSKRLFTLTGHPSFAALDPCVTGSPQPAVVDGFFMMFRPLERGTHTLRVYGTDSRGADKTYTYYLNIV
ncbi:MAG: hypothetical protein WKG32_05865 [Gemmatimonadaceae bacterium]